MTSCPKVSLSILNNVNSDSVVIELFPHVVIRGDFFKFWIIPALRNLPLREFSQRCMPFLSTPLERSYQDELIAVLVHKFIC